MRRNVILALLFPLALDAAAHEFWVEAAATRVAPEQAVSVRLFVGDGFPGEAFARVQSHIRRFEALGPDGATPVFGLEGDEPAGMVRLTHPGVHVVVYHSQPVPIELPGPRFDTYLARVGLDEIRRLREVQGAGDSPGRELFTRCAKTLIAVGEHGSGHDRVAGLPLELIPEDDPFGLEPGDALTLRAMLRGAPLPGLFLQAFERDFGSAVSSARTDAEGRAVIEIPTAGTWMISGVHMWASTDPQADWESLWTSLTIAVAEAPPRQTN